jgi:serine/threonine-protein kinase
MGRREELEAGRALWQDDPSLRVCPHCRSVYSAPIPWCRLDETPLVEQDRDPFVGSQFDRYQIVDLIGLGGMGLVYRARHAVLEKEVALKILYGEYAGEPKFVERFRREAQAISRIRHPNIVAIEDYGCTAEGVIFMAMEYVAGRTLGQLVRDHGPMDPVSVARIVRQVVLGLGAAHDLGFVHRDIKSANIMVTPDRELRILDFGSVNLAELPEDQRLTGAGNIVGTPAYMAPEQSHQSNVGPEADFYSLGVVLYELLTGELPFHGRSRAEVMVKHITEPPPAAPPSQGLEQLVAMLLEKRPEARPRTAEAVLDVLDRLPVERLLHASRAVTDEPDDDRTHFDPIPAALRDDGESDDAVPTDMVPVVGSRAPFPEAALPTPVDFDLPQGLRPTPWAPDTVPTSGPRTPDASGWGPATDPALVPADWGAGAVVAPHDPTHDLPVARRADGGPAPGPVAPADDAHPVPSNGSAERTADVSRSLPPTGRPWASHLAWAVLAALLGFLLVGLLQTLAPSPDDVRFVPVEPHANP